MPADSRPPDQEWPPHLHPHQQDARMPPRRPERQWSPGREHGWSRHPEQHGRSPPRDWPQKSSDWYDEERSHDPHTMDDRKDAPSPSDTDASVHEAVAQLAEQMKSVKGLASKLNLPNSPKTAKEWQEVAKMVAAAAAAGGTGTQQKEAEAEQGEDDTQKRVAALLANDSDSDTEKPAEDKRPSPAREFDGTYHIPPEFHKPAEEELHYSKDYGHGESHFGPRPYDFPPDDPYRHERPPPFWDARDRERFPPGRGYHRPTSPPPPHQHLPPDCKGFPPSHPRHLPPNDWYDVRPRTPPYPQYGPPLPHDIPASMLDSMTSDQQLLLAAAVNSGSGKSQ